MKTNRPLFLKEVFDQTIITLGFKKVLFGYGLNDERDPLLKYLGNEELIKLTFGTPEHPKEWSLFTQDGDLSTFTYNFTDRAEFEKKYLKSGLEKPKYVHELVMSVMKFDTARENTYFFRDIYLKDVPNVIKDFVDDDALVKKSI